MGETKANTEETAPSSSAQPVMVRTKGGRRRPLKPGELAPYTPPVLKDGDKLSASDEYAAIVDAAALGDRDAAFALAYATGPTAGNATASYLAMRGDAVTRESAGELGSRYRQAPAVQAYLRRLSMARGLTRELIESQVASLAGSDVSELAEVGNLADLARRPAHVRAAVRKVKTVRKFHKGELVDESFELELHGKGEALALGADILGMRKNQDKRGVTVNFNFAGLELTENPVIDVTNDSA